MSVEDSLIRPDYVTVYATHPAYPLLVKMRDQEAEIARVTKERDEWKQGFENLARKRHKKK